MKTIMVVDEDPILLQRYTEILNALDYTVVSCSNAEAVFAAIRKGIDVDLIITDYRMPGMDGMELIEQLRNHTPTIPMILSSVNMRSDVYRKAIDLGIVDYLLKPVSPNELGQAVATAIVHSQDFQQESV